MRLTLRRTHGIGAAPSLSAVASPLGMYASGQLRRPRSSRRERNFQQEQKYFQGLNRERKSREGGRVRSASDAEKRAARAVAAAARKQEARRSAAFSQLATPKADTHVQVKREHSSVERCGPHIANCPAMLRSYNAQSGHARAGGVLNRVGSEGGRGAAVVREAGGAPSAGLCRGRAQGIYLRITYVLTDYPCSVCLSVGWLLQ